MYQKAAESPIVQRAKATAAGAAKLARENAGPLAQSAALGVANAAGHAAYTSFFG
jgi:hypothetical protein